MDKIKNIELQLGIILPSDYKEFLLKANSYKVENHAYCRILRDNYRTEGILDEFYTIDNFIKKQEYRDYLTEDQAHFEISRDYVEAEFLYYIGEGSGSILIALGGQHYGKIYSSDNGDFGIVYQSENINQFINSLFEISNLRCTHEELMEAVKTSNLDLLKDLVENKDGNKLIQCYSIIDIDLFDIAFKNGSENILKYLISKGYKGHNRMEHYKLKY